MAGERIDQLSDRRLAAWRARHVGLVFQLYNLLPALTAERNVELPLLLTRLSARRTQTACRGWRSLSWACRTARNHYPRQLSGRRTAAGGHRPGDRHRSRRCCSATSRPATWTASPATRSWTCCRRLNREHGKTIIMVTHDPHASARATRTLYLNKGQLSAQPVK